MNMPKTIVLEVDTQEQKPLPFPTVIEWWPDRAHKPTTLKIRTVTRRIQTGDYRLESWPDLGGFERKRSSLELYSNLVTADRDRASNAFTRMAEAYHFPYLLIEETPTTILQSCELPRAMGGYTVQGGSIADRLFEAVSRHNLGLIWGGRGSTEQSRRALGEIVVRILLRHALDFQRTIS